MAFFFKTCFSLKTGAVLPHETFVYVPEQFFLIKPRKLANLLTKKAFLCSDLLFAVFALKLVSPVIFLCCTYCDCDT